MHSLIALLSLCAPAPLPRVKPTLQVEPGEYILYWGGTSYQMSLNHARGYSIPPMWWGVWSWDARKRTLTIKEWSETSYIEWTAILGRDLVGTASYGQSQPMIRLERRK